MFAKKKNIKISSEHPTAFLGPSFSNEEIREKVIDKIENNSEYKINFYENFPDFVCQWLF